MQKLWLEELETLEAHLEEIPEHVHGKSTRSVTQSLKAFLQIQKILLGKRSLTLSYQEEFVLEALPGWGGILGVKRPWEKEYSNWGFGDGARVTLYLYQPLETDPNYDIESDEKSGENPVADAILGRDGTTVIDDYFDCVGECFTDEYCDYLLVEDEVLLGQLSQLGNPLPFHIVLSPGEYRFDQAFLSKSFSVPSSAYPAPDIDLLGFIELALALSSDVADLIFSIRDIATGEADLWTWLGLLPFVPGSRRVTELLGRLVGNSRRVENLAFLYRTLEPEEFDDILAMVDTDFDQLEKLLDQDLSKYEKIGFENLHSSQVSASNTMRTIGGERIRVSAVRDEMAEEGWNYGVPYPIVVQAEDQITLITVDHRRLLAAEAAGLEEFPAIVYDFNDPIDEIQAIRFQLGEKVSPETLAALSDELGRVIGQGEAPLTWGEAVTFRAAMQRGTDPDFPLQGVPFRTDFRQEYWGD